MRHLVSVSGYGFIHATFGVSKWLRPYTRHSTKFHEDWRRLSSNTKVLPQKFESV
jgi:hypothetical protein